MTVHGNREKKLFSLYNQPEHLLLMRQEHLEHWKMRGQLYSSGGL